jgi:hypothetical protein
MIKAILYAIAAVAYIGLYVEYVRTPLEQRLAELPQLAGNLITLLFLLPVIVLPLLAVHACRRALNPNQDPEVVWESTSFESLWAGRIPMWKAFWGWHIPNTVIVAITGSYAIPRFLGHSDNRSPLLLLIFVCGCLIYHALTILGTWRSSRHHAGPRAGVLLARTGLVLSTAGTASALALALVRAIRTI